MARWRSRRWRMTGLISKPLECDMLIRFSLMLAAGFALAFTGGCAVSPDATQYYADEELRDEARSVNYQLTYNTENNHFVYDEGLVDISVRVFSDHNYNFAIHILNQTSQRVIVDWNRVEYLDTAGNPHSMIHQGVNYLDPVTKQRPTFILPGAVWSDELRPADRRTLDGAVRLVRPAYTPSADNYYDQVTIILPVKAEGEWMRYRLLMQVGMVAPTAPDSPFLPY
jgi:hypothetical protein